MGAVIGEQEINELTTHYEKWRRISRYLVQSDLNAPDLTNNRLYFRNGYPHPDWSAFVLDFGSDGTYDVFEISTERRNVPLESMCAVFSRFEDAGKYIIYEVGDRLRVQLNLSSLEGRWRDSGLDARVNKVALSDSQARYELRLDSSVYFLAYAGGIQPYNRILTLSYDELDTALLHDFPEPVTRWIPDEF